MAKKVILTKGWKRKLGNEHFKTSTKSSSTLFAHTGRDGIEEWNYLRI